MSDPQNLNQSSPGALSTGAPPATEQSLTPVPQTPSTAADAPAQSTASDNTTSPTTEAATSTNGPPPTGMGRASSGAPAQPGGAGLQQGGTVINISESGGSGAQMTLTDVKVADYVAQTNEIVQGDSTAGNFNVTLPAASSGGQVWVNNKTNNVNAITVLPAGGDTINFGANAQIAGLESIQLVSDGVSNWMVY